MPISEDILLQRKEHVDAGKIFPQIIVAFTVCLGANIWGALVGWSCPAENHLKHMDLNNDYNTEYAWTLTIAPLAGALGILPCAFFARRLGPKKAMLIQSPLNAFCWFLLAFRDNINTYHCARFFASFFSVSYITCGETLLVQSVHRKFQKVMYALYRGNLYLGILLMNTLGPILTKYWLCMLCSSGVIINSLFLIWVPESPVFLMRKDPIKAKKSLEWYRGNTQIELEFDIISHYVHFTSQQKNEFTQMFKSKAVIRAIYITSVLFVLKAMSGYYALLMDSSKWFENACITTYVDNMIFSVNIIVTRFVWCLIHLYGSMGNRKPLLYSTLITSIILAVLGYIKFYIYITDATLKCVTLPITCLASIAYHVGLSISPEITLYDYLPCQIYESVCLTMNTGVYSLIFIVSRIYLLTINNFSFYITLWALAFNLFLGYVFIYYMVVESSGKSLQQIQIELGGNPIGTRGSRRQRIASPLDHIDTDAQLKKAVEQHMLQKQSV